MHNTELKLFFNSGFIFAFELIGELVAKYPELQGNPMLRDAVQHMLRVEAGPNVQG